AEDGIRDRNVTGVQTCALPISGGPQHAVILASLILPLRLDPGADGGPDVLGIVTEGIDQPGGIRAQAGDETADVGTHGAGALGRSEERRVGEGCRFGLRRSSYT